MNICISNWTILSKDLKALSQTLNIESSQTHMRPGILHIDQSVITPIHGVADMQSNFPMFTQWAREWRYEFRFSVPCSDRWTTLPLRCRDTQLIPTTWGGSYFCHSLLVTSSWASFLIRKGRFLAVAMSMSAACSVDRKGRIRATIRFPFRIHMICTKWSSLGLPRERSDCQ